MNRVGEHQHLARVDALGAGGNAFTTSIARVCKSRGGAGKWRSMSEKVDYAVRHGFGISILKTGVRNNRAYFDALATGGTGAEHLGNLGIEVARE